MISTTLHRAAIGAKAFAAVLLALVMAVAAQPAFAQSAQELSPDHLALARKFIELTDQGATYEVTLVDMGVNTMRQLIQQNPDVGDQINNAITKVLESYRGQKDQLFNQFARVYALRFSQDELQKIVDFYESDVGKKLASENIAINQDLQAVMEVFQNNLRPEFLAKVRAELKTQGVEL